MSNQPTGDAYVRSAYGFEQAIFATRAALYDKDDAYYKVFINNLDLHDRKDALDDSAKHQLKRYVATVHINTAWYNKRIRAEMLRQNLFLGVSLALLVLMPVAVHNMTGLGEQATVLLTGLYALHRAVYAWMKRRALVVPYWSARSHLMNEIYTLETQWRTENIVVVADGGKLVLTPAFAGALRRSIATSRAFMLKTDTKYFESYQLPDLNLRTELSTAAEDVRHLTASFQSEASKRLAAHEQLEDKLRDSQIQLAGLIGKRKALDRRLKQAGLDEGEKTTLEDLRKKAVAAELTNEIEVNEQTAKIEKSRMSL